MGEELLVLLAGEEEGLFRHTPEHSVLYSKVEPGEELFKYSLTDLGEKRCLSGLDPGHAMTEPGGDERSGAKVGLQGASLVAQTVHPPAVWET